MGKRFRNSALVEYQNRKIFFSLIEKNLGQAIKKCLENFSVLLAVAKQRRAETLGGIQSAKSSGFCSKKVRISSNKHHQIVDKVIRFAIIKTVRSFQRTFLKIFYV
ncbi:hypothetical protein KAT95_02715 [Candidatus Parcubacteria bacterium]|nr:hypothetical protein [Candidatus Parcubacteria bacterium]